MAEVSEVHVRVNGWCHTCGGLGETTINHEDRFANDGVINIEQFRRPPRWVIRPPENVYWTPDEIAQIGRAVQSFQAGLPGVVEALDVSIEGLQVLPPGVGS